MRNRSLVFLLFLVSFSIWDCGPGDGSTLNPLGEPLGPPRLDVNPNEISLVLQKGNTLPVLIYIKNTGGYPLQISDIVSENDWIVYSSAMLPLSIEPGDSVQLSVDIGNSTLGAGSFTGTLTLISNDKDVEDSAFDIVITLNITEETFAFDPTFSNIQARIFSFSCTECHNSSNPPEGLNLTQGNAFSQVVNIRSSQVPELFLVEPYNPDDSYLVKKLAGDPDIVEGRMPLDQSPLSQGYIEVVRVWISQGALNN